MSARSSILVVEDNAYLVENLYKTALQDSSWTVDYAESKAEAIDRITHNSYDVAIIDIMLREDTRDRGGLDVIRELRQSGSGTEAIVVSATNDPRVATDAMSLGVSRFIAKENIESGEDLSHAVKETLAHHSERSTMEGERDSRAVHRVAEGDSLKDLAARFRELTNEWKRRSRHMSSPVQIAMLPEYQQIIGMGPSVLPLMLRDLRETGDHWFWALRAIVGSNPFGQAESGNIEEMRDAWIRWGEQRGLL